MVLITDTEAVGSFSPFFLWLFLGLLVLGNSSIGWTARWRVEQVIAPIILHSTKAIELGQKFINPKFKSNIFIKRCRKFRFEHDHLFIT